VGSQRIHPRRLVLAGGLIAAVAVAVVLVVRSRTPDFRDSVARDFSAYSSGELVLAVQARDPATIERYFAGNGIPFTTRVFDLGMMGYELSGGRVNRLHGRASALFAYRESDGRLLVCQMYEGSVAERPPAAETRVNNGITFFVHRVGWTTLVFWQEGDVVCVLASDAAPEDVIQLAFAKAVKV
jgi:anti-sigma factor RsiW